MASAPGRTATSRAIPVRFASGGELSGAVGKTTSQVANGPGDAYNPQRTFDSYVRNAVLQDADGTVRPSFTGGAANHPGALLNRGENPSTKATSPDAEPLLQMLAADEEDDRDNHARAFFF